MRGACAICAPACMTRAHRVDLLLNGACVASAAFEPTGCRADDYSAVRSANSSGNSTTSSILRR